MDIWTTPTRNTDASGSPVSYGIGLFQKRMAYIRSAFMQMPGRKGILASLKKM